MSDRLARLTPAQRALLDQRMRRDPARRPAIARRAPGRTHRLTLDQERIWLIHQFDPTDPAYNIFFATRLRGELDTDALQRSVTAFVQRHESLRTTYELAENVPVAVVHDRVDVPIRHVEVADEREVLRLAEEEIRVPFDIATGPLFRVVLYRLDERDHLMVGSIDHLVWDRASLGIFADELVEYYTAFTAGRAPELPELPIQYGDYAEWQPGWIRDEVAARHLPYWTKHLEGAELVLELPTDRPRPPVQTFNGARYQFRLTAGLTAAVREFARAESVTVNVALMAAWQLLLHRLTGQRDIIVATTSSTRSRPETEPLIGYFLTMLPLRVRVDPGEGFRELVRSARATMYGGFDHNDIPFGVLLDELDVDRDPSRNPIYQTTFIFVDFHHEQRGELPGLTQESLLLDNHTAKDDVTLGFFDDEALGGDAFLGLLEYNTDLFDQDTVVRMADQLTRLLEQAVAAPDRPVGELSLVDGEQARRQLVEWNRTDVEREPDLTVDELVRRQAARTPDAVAVSSGDHRLTYRELVTAAERVAGALQEQGAGPDDVVAVCLPRSCDLVVALLGVLMSGAAYLPLDPDHPRRRRADMAEDAGARIVLTELPAATGAYRRPPADGERLAYVIYTSGSTGRPKGVEVPHRGVANLLLAMADEIGLGPGDVLPAVTSVSFDIAGLELFGPLVTGGRCVVVTKERAQDGRALAALLTEVGATVMQATPATWHLLVEAGWRHDGGLRVVVGGEALPRALADRFAEGRTWNVYGPTETTIWSTTWRLADGVISIGTPLANTRAYVLDENFAPVPVGVPGELFLGGDGVVRGYRGRPAATAERFVPDHLSGRPGARLYRTGDRVRQRADGSLVFLGRDDDQVKLRGYRIELGEVEARLADHPDVRRAVAVVREDRPGDRRLVGYVETDNPELRTAELRALVRDSLPDYMVPTAVVPVPRFELTTSGKVDRRALPRPSVQRGEDYAAPRDPVELEVARVWEEVLGTGPIGLHDRFFDLGGHSLLVLRLIAEIERRFGQVLPMAAIFQGATVERFARLLREGYQEEDRAHLIELRAGKPDVPPLFFAHPAGSEVVCYMPFTKLLEPADRPLYALASPPPRDGRSPFATFEERARAYADLVRRTQPEGPYALAGWCYGGANAYAVAHALEEQGEQVSVVLIESHPPDLEDGPEPDRAQIVEAVAANLQWDYLDGRRTIEDLRAMSDEEHLEYLLAVARAGDYLPPDAGREQIGAVLELWVANLRLLWAYRPRPLDGRVTLIHAAQEDRAAFRTWHSLARDLDVRESPGNHYTVMRPPLVQHLAAVLHEVASDV
ncbi:putative non-ribosomal peptide synthase [Saccharothrix espanaensis DSM 44229]|uniref:Putative non-ribosomal peptide synthase n=1 Tax=Saccharothrix espanaensis (strain ATCC 51144 / DSM 44229 / JCM 9112 / NBRC 15066 / NRRL 15764) TaxID=1179773 RepID=K0K155_SACES|nr:putative non-ribosomal peptide synthase [Saccharothrix espanaensis DSM 44229]